MFIELSTSQDVSHTFLTYRPVKHKFIPVKSIVYRQNIEIFFSDYTTLIQEIFFFFLFHRSSFNKLGN